jgi:hypothetical protein
VEEEVSFPAYNTFTRDETHTSFINMDESDCAICLATLSTPGTTPCELHPCGHVFHPVCIQTWFSTKDACPVCRATVTACQHGTLCDHDKTVLMSVILSQQTHIQAMKKEEQIVKDTVLALQMRLELLTQDLQHTQQQQFLYHLIVGGPDVVPDEEEQ